MRRRPVVITVATAATAAAPSTNLTPPPATGAASEAGDASPILHNQRLPGTMQDGSVEVCVMSRRRP